MATSYTFPAGIRAMLRDDVSIEPAETGQGTQFDYGQRNRQLYSSYWQFKRITWVLNATELALFEAFFLVVGGGQAWFSLSMQLGSGYQPYECLFVQRTYNKAQRGPVFWTVSADIAIRDATMTVAEAETLLGL